MPAQVMQPLMLHLNQCCAKQGSLAWQLEALPGLVETPYLIQFTEFSSLVWNWWQDRRMQPDLIIAWSLGAHFVWQLLAQDQFPLGCPVILLAPNMSFGCQPGWPYAMPSSVLQSFSDQFQQDPWQALQYFIRLVSAGDRQCRSNRHLLQDSLLAQKSLLCNKVLLKLLQFLRQNHALTQMRSGVLAPIPMLIIGGLGDAIVPKGALQALYRQRCQVGLEAWTQWHVLPSSHALPCGLSAQRCASLIFNFMCKYGSI